VVVMLEIWKGKQILQLKDNDIEQWFDVLNYGLVEDRGFNLSDANIEKIKSNIRKDYIEYLMSCSMNKNFQAYYILRDGHNTIVAVCRIVFDEGEYYLEGLETHRDYYRKGYATQLLFEVLHELKRNNILKIYSIVRNHNIKSLNFHKKHGFMIVMEDNTSTKFSLNVKNKIRQELFDRWAKGYNKSVLKSEKEGSYPFAGYSEVKYSIIDIISSAHKARVLEMGVGTGEITKPLYELGYEITGVDLSNKMIEIAKSHMEKAEFILADFSSSLNEITIKFDFIVFSYSIHHLSYNDQIELLIKLNDYLNEDGVIIIGDVSTFTIEDMNQLQNKYAAIWDDEECYPILKKYQLSQLANLYNLSYVQINEVAGIYQLRKGDIK
jgi:2-polyprenyl-3-methyl-5-hydroxy-6-metoxy-1,4-benzoquinol methylase